MKDWFAVRSTPTEKEARGPIEETVTIVTREGDMVAKPGDYIIKEEDGNKYPISADKFDRYYEVLEK